MNKLTITLRIAMGIAIVMSALAAGFMQRSPLIVLPLGLVFTMLYVLGKIRHWKQGLERVGWTGMAAALPATIGVQLLLVGTLYFVAVGLTAVLTPPLDLKPFSQFDWLYCAGVLFGFGALAAFIAWLERNLPDPIEEALNQIGEAEYYWPHYIDELDVYAMPLTVQTLFDDFATVHAQMGGDAAQVAATGSDDKIVAAEQRLGLRLPEGLRALYRHQNGGLVNDVWAAACTGRFSNPDEVENWIGVLSANGDIVPTEHLETVADNLARHNAAGERADEFHVEGAGKLIVLSQWNRTTLFLDYREGMPPKVGSADFDDEDWDAHAFYWPDFETFFAVLRREDLE